MNPVWIPNEERIRNSNMTSFMKYVSRLLNKSVVNYDELYNWSITDIDDFWKAVWNYSRIIHSKEYSEIRTGENMFGTKWFEGAELNFAENLLRHRDSNLAIISAREDCPTVKITYEELYSYAASCAEYLRNIGIKKGDRVAAIISNIPEAIIGMLAAVSIGAIWSSCSPDFGMQGIVDRFGQIEPKVLFAMESYQYNGQIFFCADRIKSLVERIPQIKKVILIERYFDFKIKESSERKAYDYQNNFVYFREILGNGSNKIEFEQLPFNHPAYIMYSSGTTGKPKCIVQGAGGTLLQHFKELYLHTNLSRNDVITYYTTCGWMMWNWLVSSLQIGAAIFLYDGNPAYPNFQTLWKKIDEEKITIFGTSPKFLTSCQKAEIAPKEQFKLNSLKTILSTGSPLSIENFEYVYSKVKEDLQLSSISGGTDIISCFVLGNPNLPVYPGEIQCRGLGMKVEAYDENGKSIINEKGELVCTAPFPSMPVGFWNDDDRKKYKSAYFDFYPGIWRHGDYIKITERGTVIIYGRSDATLNPGGVRIGTSEIYRVVESLDEIAESIVVGYELKNDVRIILFVVLRQGIKLSKELIEKIKDEIRKEETPRHVPFKIFQVKEIPRTISGKKVELAVKKILQGEPVNNKDALSNPESLEQFKEYIPLLKN